MNISAENLDIVIRTNDYAIYNGSSILMTPDGNEFVHPGIRLLQHILREFTFYPEFTESQINCFSIYCYQKDNVEKGLGILNRNFDEILKCDPFIRKKFFRDSDKQVESKSSVLNNLETNVLPLHFNYSGSTVVSRVFNSFIYERMPKGFDITTLDYFEASEIIKSYFLSLSEDQQAAVSLLAKFHLSGIITAIFLVKLIISPSEYANAVFNLNLPHFRNEDIYQRHLHLLEHENYQAPLIRANSARKDYEKVKDEALSAVEYVILHQNELLDQPDLHELLKKGENYNVEFKSTLRMNLKSAKKDPNIEHASLKTIAGFLNSGGGTLLIGVRDDATIEGIETDDFDNDDRFSLHFWNLVKSSMGQDVSAFIQTSFEKLDGKSIFIIRCSTSTRPIFLRQSGFGEEFFIRVGPSSAKLEISEALKYINERFEKN